MCPGEALLDDAVAATHNVSSAFPAVHFSGRGIYIPPQPDMDAVDRWEAEPGHVWEGHPHQDQGRTERQPNAHPIPSLLNSSQTPDDPAPSFSHPWKCPPCMNATALPLASLGSLLLLPRFPSLLVASPLPDCCHFFERSSGPRCLHWLPSAPLAASAATECNFGVVSGRCWTSGGATTQVPITARGCSTRQD